MEKLHLTFQYLVLAIHAIFKTLKYERVSPATVQVLSHSIPIRRHQDRLKWAILPILTILFTSTFLTAQVQSRCGIFDIQKSVSAVSKTTYFQRDGFGISSYNTEKLASGKLKVHYSYVKNSVPNPLNVSYSYSITPLPCGDFAMDIEAAMPPLTLFIDSNSLAFAYEGDMYTFPDLPKADTTLPNVTGNMALLEKKSNETLLTHQITISDRKLIKSKSVVIGGKSYETFVYTYNFSQKSYGKSKDLVSEFVDSVEEMYVVNYGIVNQKRSGSKTLYLINLGPEKEIVTSELQEIQ